MLQIVEGYLKKSNEEWQKYLEDKKLVLITSLGGNWTVAAIEGEEDLRGFLTYLWETEQEHDYYTLDDMLEDAELGNYGIVLKKNDVNVTNVIVERVVCD